jgi:hypothetical protein
MLFESEWFGNAFAAPVWVTDDLEDEMFTSLGDRMRSPTDLRVNQSSEAPDRCDLAKACYWPRWIGMLTATLRQLGSRMHRRRKIGCTSAAWMMVNDRLLKDIGISRIEVEYARDAQHWG